MSAAISAGQMAVIAVAANGEEPLPFPLEVNGNRVDGKGIVYYQFVVPVDATAVHKIPTTLPSTTQPTSKPAATPATTTKGKTEG
jgi:hypothetical protein